MSFAGRRGDKLSVLTAQRQAWDDGQPLGIGELLDRWPVEASTDPDAANMIAEEFLRRKERGEEADLGDITRDFRGDRATVAGLISLRLAMETIGAASAGPSQLLRLPDVGDEIFGFRLKHPLGKGAFAQVFLAEQGDLAGRPVVLKVSAIEGAEPQTMALFQHTNIVPIYSVHEDERAGLRAVCMPYFGGASLSAILQKVWSASDRPTAGLEFVDALEAVQAPAPDLLALRGREERPGPVQGGPSLLDHLREKTFIQVAAWVVAQLADGLEHAHSRGIQHRDIKPSNVLVSAEGQPSLLDFNLSHDQNGDPDEATMGGTIAYMAPEHLRALLSSREHARVDHRSDVYALGMVLGEILTGNCPFQQSGSYSVRPVEIQAMALERSRSSPSFRNIRPDIPWGLESIARKAMDPEPDRRYQRAEHLAEDLRRFLEDRPLRHAPELSRAEQVRKLLRRNPRVATAGPVVAASAFLLAGVGWALAGTRASLVHARDRLDDARVVERVEAHDLGVTRAQCLINTAMDLPDHLGQGLALCERTLALFDPPPGSPTRVHPDLLRLGPSEQDRISEDRRELMLALAGARVRVAPGDRDALRRSLAMLDRAETIPGLRPSRALWEDRARYRELLGEPGAAATAREHARVIPATRARDHYLLAIAFAREGSRDGLRRAVEELDHALRLDPRHYWSSVQKGICHLELGDDLAAAGDFGLCVGLWPEFAWGYFNRGYVLDRGGKKAQAVEDYTAALSRDPAFLPAYLNRGLACLELRQYPMALTDFDAAIARGREDASTLAGRAMALEGMARHAEADVAFARSFALAEARPVAERDRLCWTYGFAVARRLPARAKAAFEEVLSRDRARPRALYGLAMLEAEGDRAEVAIRHLDRALAASPGFAEARRSRAVLLARRGEWAGAGQDINRCLEREPESPATLYAAGCVAALAARANSGPLNVEQAIVFLQKAVDRGESPERAAADPDLAGVSTHPRFPRGKARPAAPPAEAADQGRGTRAAR